MSIRLHLSLHLEAGINALKVLLRQPIATLLILGMLAIAMTLPLVLYLSVQNTQQVWGKLSEVPKVTIYMDKEATSEDVEHVRVALEQDARVAEFTFIDKQNGLLELQQSMNGQDLVSLLESNPLPDVFVITPSQNTPEIISDLVANLKVLPLVEQVKMDAEWMKTLYQINLFVVQIFWFLSITLGVAFVLVAHNTIRLQVLSHREEIEITKLLGAPSSFIRRPFLYQAAGQSFLAAMLSLFLCAGLLHISQPLVDGIFQPYGINFNWRFFSIPEIIVVFFVVCSLGVSGAWIATQQHLMGFRSHR